MQDKTLIIGLDGATFDIIGPMIEKGKLKNLKRLIERGVKGNLRSTIPPLSPVAWTSFNTGKNAGKHGVFSFTQLKENSYEIQYVNALSRKAKPFWVTLSEYGKKVGILNVPISFPPDKVNGFMISGMDAPGLDSNFTYPPQLKKELLDRFSDYTIDYSFIGSVKKKTGNKILQDLFKADEKRCEIAKYLMKRENWDFFLVVFVGIDRVQHFFWHCMEESHPRYHEKGSELYRDAIFNMYDDMDRLVGELIADTPESTNIIVISDHGAGPFDDSLPNLNLNSWLIENEYLALKTKRGFFSEGVKNRELNLLKNLRQYLRKGLPSGLRRWLKAALPGLHEKFQSHLYFSAIDWTKTRAFASYDEFMARGIRVNLKGREPQGIINPGNEYEILLDELINKISDFEHPFTHLPVVDKVFRREELFSGPYADRSPDLVVYWKDNAFFSPQAANSKTDSRKKESFSLTNILRSGEHRRNGIFIAAGPDILKGEEVEDADITDISPTVLYMFDLPVDNDMDGNVLTHIFQQRTTENRPVRYSEPADVYVREHRTYSEKEQKLIKKRLKDLGYLE